MPLSLMNSVVDFLFVSQSVLVLSPVGSITVYSIIQSVSKHSFCFVQGPSIVPDFSPHFITNAVPIPEFVICSLLDIKDGAVRGLVG